jgi:hypothetical protein
MLPELLDAVLPLKLGPARLAEPTSRQNHYTLIPSKLGGHSLPDP